MLDGVKKYVDGGRRRFMTATLGSNDGLYCPPGWVFADKVSNASDYVGVRILALSTESLADLEHINEHFLISSNPNDVLQVAIDHLNLIDS